MRVRPSTGELIYSLDEFSKLSAASICRRYAWGEDWVDAERDEQADKEVARGTTPP